ncbi:26S proteasome non-ATPase regulatory subunit 8-like [Oppia nitens]|uniref:26S proteasome non-ATPase regulatory subunit 8-like n=1 Tax=Oppia nitens TaxID=1686743 RepID=UPI0023DC71C0|nr:26S proteasome non-ATPase regulatory subunit 8-like [Oppia nitens]
MANTAVNDAVALYDLLKKEWQQKHPNLDKCGQLLTQLKLALTGLAFLPTTEMANNKELIISRDVLEIGALFSIAKQDIPSFERYLAQLKTYYFDYNSQLPESAFKYQLLGLNLLCLLSQNKVADFHTELELLPPKEIQNNVYIRHPISLEQYLMEGSYNKVFLSKGNVPSQTYTFFIDILLNTIREEIAACIEKSYQRISFDECARLLFFENKILLKDFANKKGWNSNGSVIQFPNVANTVSHNSNKIPAKELAEQIVDYAKELEMIV